MMWVLLTFITFTVISSLEPDENSFLQTQESCLPMPNTSVYTLEKLIASKIETKVELKSTKDASGVIVEVSLLDSDWHELLDVVAAPKEGVNASLSSESNNNTQVLSHSGLQFVTEKSELYRPSYIAIGIGTDTAHSADHEVNKCFILHKLISSNPANYVIEPSYAKMIRETYGVEQLYVIIYDASVSVWYPAVHEIPLRCSDVLGKGTICDAVTSDTAKGRSNTFLFDTANVKLSPQDLSRMSIILKLMHGGTTLDITVDSSWDCEATSSKNCDKALTFNSVSEQILVGHPLKSTLGSKLRIVVTGIIKETVFSIGVTVPRDREFMSTGSWNSFFLLENETKFVFFYIPSTRGQSIIQIPSSYGDDFQKHPLPFDMRTICNNLSMVDIRISASVVAKNDHDWDRDENEDMLVYTAGCSGYGVRMSPTAKFRAKYPSGWFTVRFKCLKQPTAIGFMASVTSALLEINNWVKAEINDRTPLTEQNYQVTEKKDSSIAYVFFSSLQNDVALTLQLYPQSITSYSLCLVDCGEFYTNLTAGSCTKMPLDPDGCDDTQYRMALSSSTGSVVLPKEKIKTNRMYSLRIRLPGPTIIATGLSLRYSSYGKEPDKPQLLVNNMPVTVNLFPANKFHKKFHFYISDQLAFDHRNFDTERFFNLTVKIHSSMCDLRLEMKQGDWIDTPKNVTSTSGTFNWNASLAEWLAREGNCLGGMNQQLRKSQHASCKPVEIDISSLSEAYCRFRLAGLFVSSDTTSDAADAFLSEIEQIIDGEPVTGMIKGKGDRVPTIGNNTQGDKKIVIEERKSVWKSILQAGEKQMYLLTLTPSDKKRKLEIMLNTITNSVGICVSILKPADLYEYSFPSSEFGQCTWPKPSSDGSVPVQQHLILDIDADGMVTNTEDDISKNNENSTTTNKDNSNDNSNNKPDNNNSSMLLTYDKMFVITVESQSNVKRDRYFQLTASTNPYFTLLPLNELVRFSLSRGTSKIFKLIHPSSQNDIHLYVSGDVRMIVHFNYDFSIDATNQTNLTGDSEFIISGSDPLLRKECPLDVKDYNCEIYFVFEAIFDSEVSLQAQLLSDGTPTAILLNTPFGAKLPPNSTKLYILETVPLKPLSISYALRSGSATLSAKLVKKTTNVPVINPNTADFLVEASDTVSVSNIPELAQKLGVPITDTALVINVKTKGASDVSFTVSQQESLNVYRLADSVSIFATLLPSTRSVFIYRMSPLRRSRWEPKGGLFTVQVQNTSGCLPSVIITFPRGKTFNFPARESHNISLTREEDEIVDLGNYSIELVSDREGECHLELRAAVVSPTLDAPTVVGLYPGEPLLLSFPANYPVYLKVTDTLDETKKYTIQIQGKRTIIEAIYVPLDNVRHAIPFPDQKTHHWPSQYQRFGKNHPDEPLSTLELNLGKQWENDSTSPIPHSRFCTDEEHARYAGDSTYSCVGLIGVVSPSDGMTSSKITVQMWDTTTVHLTAVQLGYQYTFDRLSWPSSSLTKTFNVYVPNPSADLTLIMQTDTPGLLVSGIFSVVQSVLDFFSGGVAIGCSPNANSRYACWTSQATLNGTKLVINLEAFSRPVYFRGLLFFAVNLSRLPEKDDQIRLLVTSKASVNFIQASDSPVEFELQGGETLEFGYESPTSDGYVIFKASVIWTDQLLDTAVVEGMHQSDLSASARYAIGHDNVLSGIRMAGQDCSPKMGNVITYRKTPQLTNFGGVNEHDEIMLIASNYTGDYHGACFHRLLLTSDLNYSVKLNLRLNALTPDTITSIRTGHPVTGALTKPANDAIGVHYYRALTPGIAPRSDATASPHDEENYFFLRYEGCKGTTVLRYGDENQVREFEKLGENAVGSDPFKLVYYQDLKVLSVALQRYCFELITCGPGDSKKISNSAVYSVSIQKFNSAVLIAPIDTNVIKFKYLPDSLSSHWYTPKTRIVSVEWPKVAVASAVDVSGWNNNHSGSPIELNYNLQPKVVPQILLNDENPIWKPAQPSDIIYELFYAPTDKLEAHWETSCGLYLDHSKADYTHTVKKRITDGSNKRVIKDLAIDKSYRFAVVVKYLPSTDPATEAQSYMTASKDLYVLSPFVRGGAPEGEMLATSLITFVSVSISLLLLLISLGYMSFRLYYFGVYTLKRNFYGEVDFFNFDDESTFDVSLNSKTQEPEAQYSRHDHLTSRQETYRYSGGDVIGFSHNDS